MSSLLPIFQKDKKRHAEGAMVIKNIVKNEIGMTLIELVIGMAVTTLLMAAMVSNLLTAFHAWQAGKTRSEVEQSARYAAESIIREIRYANKIHLNSKSSITITKNNPSTGKVAETITFRYGSSESKMIYKVTDKSASGGGSGTNPLTPAVIKNLEFEYAPTAERNIVTIIIQATDYKGELVEYRSMIRCLNALTSE